MSRAQFARVHAGLLARKGEAAPAVAAIAGNIAYLDAPAFSPTRMLRAQEQEHVEVEDTQGEHFRLSLRMTHEQRRWMWLVSARLGLSRQAILDRALDAFMGELACSDMKDCSCFHEKRMPGSCD